MTIPAVDRRADVARHAIGSTRRVGTRSSGVDGAVLHQMGFIRNGGVHQYDAVCAHFAVLRSGTILFLHDIEASLHASNGLNSRGIAIEFEGAFPSERGRWHRAVPESQQVLPTVAQIMGGRDLIKALSRHWGIAFVFAHRQANADTKSNCPGPHIWYNVGEHFVRAGLLSSGGPGFTHSRGRRTGAAIPESWTDPSLALIG